MNTAVTIPWEAVVEGCPPSKHPEGLPLVVAKHCYKRGDHAPGDGYCGNMMAALERISVDSLLAVASRSDSSTLVEVLLPCGESQAVATLTSDGQSSVVLQGFWSPQGTWDTFEPELQADELVRTYVLRYARMDADARAFVLPDGDADRDALMQFVRPENWGFRAEATRRTWNVSRLNHLKHPHVVNRYCDTHPVLSAPYRSPFEEPTPDRGDPLLCLPSLRHVRAALETGLCSQTPALWADSLCYRPALALGRCRLFGVRVPQASDFTLGPVAFFHAWDFLRMGLRSMMFTDAYLDSRIARGGAYAHRNVALELLETRMDFHAAYLALDEAYAAALYDGSPEVPAMSRRLTQVRRLINLFDGNLQKNLPLLRLAASTYLLDNWRRLLAPTHRDCPPWWLDGCIG